MTFTIALARIMRTGICHYMTAPTYTETKLDKLNMTLAYGWIIKIQKRISDALVSGQLTKWEMQFIQTIDTKLDRYKTDSNLSNNQHQKLFTILTKAENPKTHDLNPGCPLRSSFELAAHPFSTGAHDIHLRNDIKDSDYSEDRGHSLHEDDSVSL